MLKYLLLIFSLSFTIHLVLAQNTLQSIGGRSAAMGKTGVASYDFWSVNNNQAGLAFMEKSGVGFYYQNLYLVNDLNYNQLSAVLKTYRGGFGVNVSYFGYGQYNEKKVGLAYGMQLGKRFSIGAQLDYLHTYIAQDYGSKGVVTFELGMMAKINEDLTLGAHVFNPISAKLAEYDDERIPTLLSLGLNWKLSSDFTAAVEAQSDIDNPLILKAGLEYNIMDLIYIRIGLSNNPNVFTFGAGLYYSGFRLDFSSSMHQVLGYSPQMSAQYLF